MKYIALAAMLLSFNSYAILELNQSSPKHSMNLFLKKMKEYKEGNNDAILLASKTLDLSKFSSKLAISKGREFSEKLINTLDKLERVDVSKIPLKPSHDIWFYRKENIKVNGESVEVEISLALNKEKKWSFTHETLMSLNSYQLYLKDTTVVKNVIQLKSVRQKIKDSLPSWVLKESLLLTNFQWFSLILITILSLLIDKILRVFFTSKLLTFLGRKKLQISKKRQKKITSSFGLLLFSLIFKWLLTFLELPQVAILFIGKLFEIIVVVGSISLLVQLVEIISVYLQEKAKLTDNKFDDILVPFVRKTLIFFIYSFGLIAVGDVLSLDMKNILAGLGIGGIAFAFAAKDTIANLFGSFTVLLDRPFSIGDYVDISGHADGIVEEVGLRSTRIRTFHDSLVTVPNGVLINATIDNLGKRRYRRFNTTLQVEYSTPVKKIEEFCQRLRDLIKDHPHTRKENYHVYFNNLGSSSLDILLYMFFSVPDWASELKFKHEVLIEIMKISEELEISFAFPTRTLHIQK